VGSRTRVKVVKNKMAPPFKECEFDILHGEGISREGELLDLGLEKKVITRRGTWYSMGDLQLGQGRDNSRVYLKENPEITRKLDIELRTLLGLPPSAITAFATPPPAPVE